MTGDITNRNTLTIRRVTWGGLIINLALSWFKMAAGIIGSSQAVFADGIHSLSDSITDIAVILGSYFWYRPPDECHPYGHQRIETLVTIFIGLVLLAAGIGIGWEAVATFHQNRQAPPEIIAIVAAGLSLVLKEALYRWTVWAGRKTGSKALMANAWHHRLDALSSIPALIAVSVARLYPGHGFLDRIGALCVAALIIHAGFKIIWPSLQELTEAGVKEEIRKQIEEFTGDVPRVKDCFNIRSRYIGKNLFVDMKIHVDGHLSVYEGHQIAAQVKKRILGAELDVADVLIHVEPAI